MALPQEKIYEETLHTVDDIYALPEGERAELFDGQMYMMAAPNTLHQILSGELFAIIHDYIKSNNGDCMVFHAPFAVFLNKDSKNYVEPDISVICDKDKLDERGCNGAPDWIIEIVSPSSSQIDYGKKLFKYRTAGVREYWIINPIKRIVNVFDFERGEERSNLYDFEDAIPSCIYPELTIQLSELGIVGK